MRHTVAAPKSMSSTRTYVTFRSAVFNTTVPREGFLTPGNYGEDLARWLMRELRRQGMRVDNDLAQEERGWSFGFDSGGVQYVFMVAYRDEEEAEWVGWIERSVSLFASIYRSGDRQGLAEAAQTIHDVLTSAPHVEDVAWHLEEDYLAGREEKGQAEPV